MLNKMISIIKEPFWTSKKDFQIVLKSIIQSFKACPRLIWLNIPFIVIFLALKGFYSYKFIYTKDDGLIRDISEANFILLQLCFLVFLIAFQLHYKGSMTFKKFGAFLKQTTTPFLIESLKAIGYILGYLILSIFISILGYEIVLRTFDSSLLILILLSLFILLPIFIVTVMCFLMFIARGVQYQLVPFVVFFDAEYLKTKKGAISKTLKVSKGIVLPFLFFSFISFILAQYLFPFSIVIEPEPTVTSLIKFALSSLIDTVVVIFFYGILYYIFQAKSNSQTV